MSPIVTNEVRTLRMYELKTELFAVWRARTIGRYYYYYLSSFRRLLLDVGPRTPTNRPMVGDGGGSERPTSDDRQHAHTYIPTHVITTTTHEFTIRIPHTWHSGTRVRTMGNWERSFRGVPRRSDVTSYYVSDIGRARQVSAVTSPTNWNDTS